MNPIGGIGTCSLMCALACLEPLPAMPTSLYLTLAQGINDAGEITGSAIDTATTPQTVGFLAVPVFDGSGNPHRGQGQSASQPPSGGSHRTLNRAKRE